MAIENNSAYILTRMHSKLPISHPDYTYPPAKNIYAAKNLEFEKTIYSDGQTEKHKGLWRSLFLDAANEPAPSPARPLHVEIGCNGGHWILEAASRNPDAAFIGVDWKFKQIHRGAEKAEKRSIKNLIFFRSNSERLKYCFAPEEIDFMYLFFPDPWAKKSQLKNRFFTESRLRELAPLVKKGGIFEIRTDHANYFEWMCEHAEKVKDIWQMSEVTRDRYADHPSPEKLDLGEVTLFEKLFIKDKIKIKRMVLIKL